MFQGQNMWTMILKTFASIISLIEAIGYSHRGSMF